LLQPHDGPDNRLPGFGVEKIDLGRIVPGHGSSIVPMVNVPSLPGVKIYPLEHHRRVAPVVVMVLDINAYPRSRGKIFTVEGISRERRLAQL